MKKFMKALALALALCMVLSVSAFAVGETGKTVDTEDHTVTFTVTGLTAGEQVALMVLRDGATLATASESNILYIDQKAVATGATSVDFTATIAASTETVDNDVVDVYVGSQSINSDKTGAWAVYENVEVAETSGVTLSSTAATIVNVGETKNLNGEDVTIERPGAAIGITPKNVSLKKMIWVLNDVAENGDNNYKFSKPVSIDVAASVEGEVWFTGVFSSASLTGYTIDSVAAIFLAEDGETEYYAGVTESGMAGYRK